MASFLQMKALDFSFNLFHTSFLSLFDPPSPSFIQQENELQSLPEFLSMGSRRPNPQGTGRNIITKTRNKLYLLKLSKKNLKIDFRILSQLIKAFFGLECLILEKELFCKKKGRGFSLLDEDKALEFPLKSYKGKIDVFSIFDVMVEYVPNDGFAVIGIINEDIYDPEVDNNIIYGRACGDRVAVISDLGNIKTTMQTVLHETLHTMGLDHCIAWKCLMNAFIVDTFDLCPLELKKLEAVTKQPLLEREKALLKVFKKMGYKEEIRRSLKKIAALKK